MGVFDQAISGAMNTLKCVAGTSVTYHRGASWVRLTAIPGQSTFELSDEFGGIVETRTRDYTFKAGELLIGGMVVTPARGDFIKEDVGNKVHVHEVMRPDGGEQPWRYADHGRSSIRVHTKLKEIVNKV